MAQSSSLVDPSVFEALQAKIDDDTAVRDQLKEIVQSLEKQQKKLLAHLANAQAQPAAQRVSSIQELQGTLLPPMLSSIQELKDRAGQHPYYKFNQMWSRHMQDAAQAILLIHYHTSSGALLQLDAVAARLGVPGPQPNSDVDQFHLTTEEYLQALVSLIEDLTRLSRLSVTQHDYRTPLQVAQFVKDIHAGFQVLNLKNDSLRRRSDGIKYRLRETEDVVYDLSLRGLLPKEDST